MQTSIYHRQWRRGLSWGLVPCIVVTSQRPPWTRRLLSGPVCERESEFYLSAPMAGGWRWDTLKFECSPAFVLSLLLPRFGDWIFATSLNNHNCLSYFLFPWNLSSTMKTTHLKNLQGHKQISHWKLKIWANIYLLFTIFKALGIVCKRKNHMAPPTSKPWAMKTRRNHLSIRDLHVI